MKKKTKNIIARIVLVFTLLFSFAVLVKSAYGVWLMSKEFFALMVVVSVGIGLFTWALIYTFVNSLHS